MFKIKNPLCTPGVVEIKQPAGFPIDPDWKQRSFYTLRSNDKKLLYTRVFLSPNFESKAKARVLLISHGQSEHSGRYLHHSFYLNGVVDAIVIPDHRGHGVSEGVRGHSSKFELFANDLAKIIEEIPERLHKNRQDLEIHILGHSMGGLISLDLLNRFPNLGIQSAAINAPMIDFVFSIPRWKEVLGKGLLKITPWFPVPSENIIKLVSSDRNVVISFASDPYTHGYVTPAFYYGYLESKNRLLKGPFQVATPLMLQVPANDKIIEPSITASKLFPNILSKDKKLVVYKDFSHETYNEPLRALAFKDLKQWILKHSSL